MTTRSMAILSLLHFNRDLNCIVLHVEFKLSRVLPGGLVPMISYIIKMLSFSNDVAWRVRFPLQYVMGVISFSLACFAFMKCEWDIACK